MHFSPAVAKLQLVVCCVVAHFLDRFQCLLGIVDQLLLVAVAVSGGQDLLYVVVLLNEIFTCWVELQILGLR